MSTLHLPPRFRALLAQYRGKLLRRDVLAALFAGLALFLGLLLLGANSERWLPGNEALVRWSILFAMLIPSVALVLGLLIRTRHHLGDLLGLCHKLERLLGSSRENMASGYQLLHPDARTQADETMLARLEADAEKMAEAAALKVPPSRLARRSLGVGAIFLCLHAILCLIPGYQYPLMLARVILPWQSLEQPAFTRIEVSATPAFLPRGDDLPVTVALSGRIPERAHIAWTHDPKANEWQRTALQRTGRTSFLHYFVDLPESLSFRVEAGDAISPEQTVKVVDRPAMDAVQVEVEWPDYTGRSRETFTGEEALDLRAVTGSSFTVKVRPSQETTNASLRLERDGESELIPLETGDDGWAKIPLSELTTSLIWTAELTDEHGFENADRDAYRITVMEDAGPQVRLIAPDNSMAVHPSETVPLEIQAEDDFGLRQVDLIYRRNPDPDIPRSPERMVVRTLEEETIETKLAHPVEIRASELGGMPGDVIEIEAEVRDTLQQAGRSQTITLRVLAFDPGREERIRLENLRLLRSWLNALMEVPASERASWQWPLADSQTGTLIELAEAAGIPPLATATDPTAVYKRILEEQRLTEYPLYRSDLRDLLAQTGLVLLGAEAEVAHEILTRWTSQDLPAQINYRATHNMLFALRTLRNELERLVQAEGDKGLDDFRRTASDWFAESGRILRDASIAVEGVENNANFVRELSTALFSLDPDQEQTWKRLLEGLTKLEEAATLALPGLAEQLVEARQQRHEEKEGLFSQITTSEIAGSEHTKTWSHLLWESATEDAALAPAAGAWTYVLQQALSTPDPYQRNLAAADRFRRNPPEMVQPAWQAWMVEALRGFTFHRLTPAGGDLRPADAVLEQMFYAVQEKAIDLDIHAPLPAVETLSPSTLPGFEQNVNSLLQNALADFAQSGLAWQEQIESIENTLARFVPSTTVEMRQILLQRETAFLASARNLSARLRFNLRLGWEPSEDAPLDRRSQIALLLALEFRTGQFLSRAAEPRSIFLQYEGESYPPSELELFATRINQYKGGALGLIRLASAMAPLGKTDPEGYDPEPLTEESARIALAQPLYELLDRIGEARKGEIKPSEVSRSRAQAIGILTELLVQESGAPGVMKDPEKAEAWQNAVRALARLDPPLPSGTLSPAILSQAVARATALRSAQNWEALASESSEPPQAADWFTQALASLLVPAVTEQTGAVYRGGRGTEPERQRLWLVDELRESERMPPPDRFPGQTRDYLDHLRRSFRQHPHTR